MVEAEQIPIVVVEEHREALTALAWARQVNVLGTAPVHFYNVDHHADLDVPRLAKPLSSDVKTLLGIKKLVDSRISISAFIWMGAYLGLIDRLSWLPPKAALGGTRIHWGPAKSLFVATSDRKRTAFITAGIRKDTDGLGNDDRMPLTVETVGFPCASTTRKASFLMNDVATQVQTVAQQWVLSIDLDYFSCNSQPHNPFRLTVDQKTYASVVSDPRHPLRCSVYHHVEAVEDALGYGILFDAFPEQPEDPLRRNDTQIDAALQELTQILLRRPTPPALIIIARSRLSGFTPRDQWMQIEHGVLAQLHSLYPCQKFDGETLWN